VSAPDLPALHHNLRERAAIIIESNPYMTDDEVRQELRGHVEWEAFVKAGGVEWIRKQKTQSGNGPSKEE
jgi:hypothetical protein